MRIAVTEPVCALAFLRSLPAGELHAEAALFADDLGDDWQSRTGLRRRDLDRFLSTLVMRNLLVPVDETEARFAPTEAGLDFLRGGYRRAYSLVERLRAALLLLYTANRHRFPTPRKRAYRAPDRDRRI